LRAKIPLRAQDLNTFAADRFIIGAQQEMDFIPGMSKLCPVVTAHGSASDNGNFHC
jgi:hypothetical protein